MKRLLLAAGLVAFAVPARAAGPVYAGVHLDLAFFHDVDASDALGPFTVDYDTGFGIGGVVGYRANPNFRLEGEISYRSADVHSIDGGPAAGVSLATTAFMVNGYYDFAQVRSSVVPFVGLGIGFINGVLTGTGQSYSDTEFGYQITLGLAFHVSPHASLLADYRFQGSSDFSANGTTLPYKASNVQVGLNYLF